MARNTLSEEWLQYHVSRRSFMAGGLALFATRPVPLIGQPRQTPQFAGPPFSLGVASGDPSPDGAVLWIGNSAVMFSPGDARYPRSVPVAVSSESTAASAYFVA